jgi:hypothetical protein
MDINIIIRRHATCELSRVDDLAADNLADHYLGRRSDGWGRFLPA